MAPDFLRSFRLDEWVLEQLACPACRADLRMKEDRLACAGCGRMFPVVEGIPVLIAGREENLRPTDIPDSESHG
jgi:hypothetical protein